MKATTISETQAQLDQEYLKMSTIGTIQMMSDKSGKTCPAFDDMLSLTVDELRDIQEDHRQAYNKTIKEQTK